MSKHTPGPWAVNGNEIIAQDTESDTHIAAYFVRVATIDDTKKTGWTKPVIRANASLIAAAPDLLAALQNLLGDVEAEYDSRNVAGTLTKYARDVARAALAKALGN